MTRVLTSQTLELLFARSVEEGDCRLWTGYHAGNNGETPYVSHEGRMTSVRKVIALLQGRAVLPGRIWGCSCGNLSCIEPSHAVQRTMTEHARNMARRLADGPQNKVRAAKVTISRRAMSKLNAEAAAAIRASEESGPVLGQRYGVTRTTINSIKRGERWRDYSSPFAGLTP